MAENPSPVKDGNLRKIEIMPSRSEETNDGKTEQVEHAEGKLTLWDFGLPPFPQLSKKFKNAHFCPKFAL